MPTFLTARRICNIALGAWGYCSTDTLVNELRRELGLSLHDARHQVYTWALDPRVKIDDHGNYYIEGLGGA